MPGRETLVRIEPAATLKHSESEILSWRFSSFKVSDRDYLHELLRGQHLDLVKEALLRFIEGWERAEWKELYSVQRVGKWVALENNETLINDLRAEAVGRIDSAVWRALVAGLDMLPLAAPVLSDMHQALARSD